MSRVSGTLPNLIGGVSQQPPSVRFASNSEEDINFYPSVVEGLTPRNHREHVAKLRGSPIAGSTYTHSILRDSIERYKVIISNQSIQVFDLDGSEQTVTAATDFSYLDVADARKDLHALTIADFTFITNKTKVCEMDPVIPASRGAEALVLVRQGAYSSEYRVTVDGTTLLKTTLNNSTSANADDIQTDSIAEDLAGQIAGLTGFEAERYGAVIWVKKTDGSNFDIGVSDSQAGNALKLTTHKVQRFTDLPTSGPRGFITEVIGEPDQEYDNYFVEFEMTDDGGTMGEGQWVETVDPEVGRQFLKETMPHVLVRKSDGSFEFRSQDWLERFAGDDNSNKIPSFIGETIRSIFFWKNRLAFISPRNLIFSEAGEYFSFWKTTVTTNLDTDRIDVAANHTKVATLSYALPFDEELVVFSDTTQFNVTTDGPLTADSISIDPATEFESLNTVAPVATGTNIYFPQKLGGFTGIREYLTTSDNNTKDAADVTRHVPKYIAGKATKMTASSTYDALVVLTNDAPNELYLYSFYWSGNQKLQSAWTKWAFEDGAEILNAEFVEESLFLVMQYADGVYLERIRFDLGWSDPNAGYVTRLDRRVSDLDCTVSYDSSLNETTITLPYSLDQEPTVVTRADGGTTKPGRTSKIKSFSGDQVVITGNVATKPLWVGYTYEARHRFSPIIMRTKGGADGTPVSIGVGRLQLLRGHLQYSDSTNFKIDVSYESGAARSYRFTGRIVGSANNVIGEIPIEDGVFKFAIKSKSDRVTIDLVSDSFLPCSFQSLEWEANFILRSRRV